MLGSGVEGGGVNSSHHCLRRMVNALFAWMSVFESSIGVLRGGRTAHRFPRGWRCGRGAGVKEVVAQCWRGWRPDGFTIWAVYSGAWLTSRSCPICTVDCGHCACAVEYVFGHPARDHAVVRWLLRGVHARVRDLVNFLFALLKAAKALGSSFGP